MAGEWSLAINDCGKWVNNIGNGQRFDGTYFNPDGGLAFAGVGSCDVWNVRWTMPLCFSLRCKY